MPNERFRQPKSRLHSSRKEYFARPPDRVVEYKLGDIITRENFTSLLVQSFAISRGQPTIQLAFFMWLDKKYDFDYLNILKSFVEEHTWQTLSEEEKARFVKAFDKVPKHAQIEDRNVIPESEDYIRHQLADNIKIILSPSPERKGAARRFFNFNEINSMADFNQSAAVCFNYLASLE